MQIQDDSGMWRKPEALDVDKMESLLAEVRRVVVFEAYDGQGRPTKELRRAWRRCKAPKPTTGRK